MRRPLLLLTLASAALVAACSSSAEPGWTYAPPTAPPASQPAASGGASVPPASVPPASAPASEAPSGEAPSGEAPSGGGAGDVVTLTASNINWVEKELAVPAGTAFTLHLDNQDNGVPHDVVIKDSTGAEIAKSAVVTGVAAGDVAVPALAAGAYTYVCSIHPSMTGTLTAGG